jgi:hypothetical protein
MKRGVCSKGIIEGARHDATIVVNQVRHARDQRG